MSVNAEDQQLLEDASTLLMFASAAARQRSPASQNSPDLATHNIKLPPSTESPPVPSPQNVAERTVKLEKTSARPLPPLPLTETPAPPKLYTFSTPVSMSHHAELAHTLPPEQQSIPHGYVAAGAPVLHAQSLSDPNFATLGKLATMARTVLEASGGVTHANSHASGSSALHSPRQNAASGAGFRTHKRSISAGDASSVNPPVGALALARGINRGTQQRNLDNVAFAAAALAAAAEFPIPLRNKEGVTAPEDDENRTEDEAEQKDTALIKKSSAQGAEVVKSEFKPDTNTPLGNLNVQAIPNLQTSDHTAHMPAPHSGANLVSRSFPIPQGVLPPVPHPLQHGGEAKMATPKLDDNIPYRPPSLHLYRVDPDAGLIGCICGIEEDDGFTIQCDICFRWQHCSCMGYKTSSEVPEDEYKCYFCDEHKWNKFDAAQCREETIARLEQDRIASEPELRSTAPKRKLQLGRSDDKKRRKSVKELKPVSSDKPVPEKRKSSALVQTESSPKLNAAPEVKYVNNKDNPLLRDGISAETYEAVYYRLSENDYKTSETREKYLDIVLRTPTSCELMPLADFKRIKFSKVLLPHYQNQASNESEQRRNKNSNKTAVQVKTYSENPKSKFAGISKTGLFITDKLATPGNEYSIAEDTPVMCYYGELDFFENYARNPVNQYSLCGTVKPRIAKLKLPDTDTLIVLDARFVGNETRFIRRSCANNSNCEIRPIYIPQLRTYKFVVYTTKPIYLKGDALEEELRLPWEWEPEHPILKMLKQDSEGKYKEGLKFEDFSDDDKAILINSVDQLSNLVECGCHNTPSSSVCPIFKIKKIQAYLLRATRKAFSHANLAISKNKEDLLASKNAGSYIPWKERLIERDLNLQKELIPDPVVEQVTITAESRDSPDPDHRSSELEERRTTPDVTFRQRYLALVKEKANRLYVMGSESDHHTMDVSKDLLDVPKFVYVPVVPELLESIKFRVNLTLQSITSLNLQKTELKNLETSDKPPAAAIITIADTLAVAPEKKIEPLQGPPIVKKLLFADYKKQKK